MLVNMQKKDLNKIFIKFAMNYNFIKINWKNYTLCINNNNNKLMLYKKKLKNQIKV